MSVEMENYLRFLAEEGLQVILVDGSSSEVFEQHAKRLLFLEHRRPDPDLACANGKAAGVLTGVRYATSDIIIIADDDVRYDENSLSSMLSLLTTHAVVRPQNYFDPLPWHAAWDSSRVLINRVTGGDWPGTFGIQRKAFISVGGYRGDVLFENFQMVKTLTEGGCREHMAQDLFVRRLPCDARHFVGQRVRQAYDELARPRRFTAQLMMLPLTIIGVKRFGIRLLLAAGVVSVTAAEAGRRRLGGRSVFPPVCSLWAPAWVAERAMCTWVALLLRSRGGVRYGSARLERASAPVARGAVPMGWRSNSLTPSLTIEAADYDEAKRVGTVPDRERESVSARIERCSRPRGGNDGT